MKLPVYWENMRNGGPLVVTIRDDDRLEVCRVYSRPGEGRIAFYARVVLLVDRLNGIGGKVDVHG